MDDKFGRPSEILHLQDMFGEREVGVTHPDVSSHLRLRDNGDIEMISGEGMGIVFNRKTRTVTIFADNVRVLTKDHQGLRWNKLAFNPKAVNYNEPTFKHVTDEEIFTLYKGTDAFLGDD